MFRSHARIAAAAVAAALITGCYGSKLVRGPINSEHASSQADSIRAETRELLQRVARLEAQLAEEREQRMRSQAQVSTTLSELDESVRILISRVEESASLEPQQRQPVRTVIIQQAPGQASDSALVDSIRASAEGDEEGEVYRAAYLDLTRGNYDLATRGFEEYLEKFPDGIYLPEVRYYLGDCYFATENYLKAVGEFRRVVEEFPDSRLVPAAYLKSGRCYVQLEEKNLAERAFRTLIEEHPTTEEARQAREALAALEG